MTSKLTREERVQALYDLKVGQVLSLADIENVKMLSRMALEKAQQRNGELETYSITALEFREAARDENRRLKVDLDIAEKRIAELESRTVTDWIEHDGKWRPESLGLDELVYLKTRKQELKIPYPAGKVKGWMNTGGDMDVMAYKLASPQASTVTVKLTDINEYLAEVHDKTLNRALRLLAEGVRAGDVAAMRAAGIKVETE
ncbi:hypothetical protein [Klebsiella pneumoniae]|uniref:hypothetical protein n=1 Tax=Klebsiella pneumoniae TaxID=573 RepID=UPI000E2A7179|nr:hypothetical protein [Klebsiella pneumoniae]MEB2958821.1 hypothetical protein [Klebsiella pneumoniae]SVP85974.1 Uncharacterised protein [Klebsiella pneumoniae]SVQ08312.1 Uncharacterised protein [Klebsiella pneumoniae]SVQ59695.1 Uncharacterised protein [Klebsiella pneumoniae]SVQ68257.1 Uncharacterised protein [Klebsiella pneumoniae]